MEDDLIEKRQLPSGVNVRHEYVKLFMGTSYDLSDIGSIGMLRKTLEEIAKDLPSDDSLTITELTLEKGELSYLLEEAIAQ